MKNDIDEILNSIFEKNAETGKSKAAQEAEEFLKQISEKNKNQKKQMDTIFDIEKTSEKINNDIAKITEELNKDGFKTETVKIVEEKADINASFLSVEEKIKTTVIGQDDFIHKLTLAFKRPFVMGEQNGKPKSTIVVSGKIGTGRHSALNSIVSELEKSQLIQGEKPAVINLALYSTSGDLKIFTQDLFSAIESKSSVILLENYEKCHKSLLSVLNEMVSTAKVQLGSRYANQKGMLIDVGSALVPNAISSISCKDKYLVFLTSKHESDLADSFGGDFINKIDDICNTQNFSTQSLRDISKNIIEKFKEKTLKMLGFNLSTQDDLDIYFSSKFTVTQGVNSIEDYSLKCYKLLSEYKLESSLESGTCEAVLNEGILSFKFKDKTLVVENQYQDNAGVVEVKAKMEEIVGLDPVKKYIFSLEENYKVQKLRSNLGLKVENPSMHMIFTGNPGTGKTTIARIVSRYLKAMGVLSGGQLIEVSRSDLVGRYVGHTAPLTMQVIESAIGGVLFIDEAYSLYRGEDDSFGLEAIDTLVKGMEDNRDNLLVILAGYTKEMEGFLKSNSGLVSRFPNVIEFPDYSAEELWEITLIIAKNKGYKVDISVKEKLLHYFEEKQMKNSRTSGNGRMARNALENAILNQSQRLLKENSNDYETLLESDFEL